MIDTCHFPASVPALTQSFSNNSFTDCIKLFTASGGFSPYKSPYGEVKSHFTGIVTSQGCTFIHAPVTNKILPEVRADEAENEDYPYTTLEEAIARIQELEGELDSVQQANKDGGSQIEELQSQVRKLQKYRDNEAEFEALRQEFYEEVVFGDKAPDIAEYQKFYAAINPDNAEVLYKEVVEQQEYDSKVDDYVKTYSSIKAKEAAAIFNSMTDNLSLVKRILEKMSASSRGDILAAMNQDTAAKLTEMLEPSK